MNLLLITIRITALKRLFPIYFIIYSSIKENNEDRIKADFKIFLCVCGTCVQGTCMYDACAHVKNTGLSVRAYSEVRGSHPSALLYHSLT